VAYRRAAQGLPCDEPRIDLQGRFGDILVPLHRDPKLLAGAIRGELLREGGPWTSGAAEVGQRELDLVPVSGATWEPPRRARQRARSRGRVPRFTFDHLPPASTSSRSRASAWRWNPTSLRVTPPIDNLTFCATTSTAARSSSSRSPTARPAKPSSRSMCARWR
jgi:hypothetical protein